MLSPVRHKHVVEAAQDLINEAKSAVFVSALFGLSKKDFHGTLESNSRSVLEYGLANSTAYGSIRDLNHHNTRFFPPKRLKRYMGENWDAKTFGAHKIHTKTLIIDPWGNNPAVFIGSANFSGPSCTKNDENMLLIRGDKRIAAMVAAEFMRMYEHYRSRFWIAKIAAQIKESGQPSSNSSWYLKNTDAWSRTAFQPGSRSHKYRDRIVFSGGE